MFPRQYFVVKIFEKENNIYIMRKKSIKSDELKSVKLLHVEQGIDFPFICKFIQTTLNVTQKEIAEKLQVTTRTYRYWESGKRVPKSWQAINLALLYMYAKEKTVKTNFEDPQSQAA